ncbi:ABC transporter permease subunit [Streptomyces sp. RGM 3693]|uniref:ABC transporter permease subunit n=1 Tax=Streptomyces sp. RGM 3693 TaxID=3413284 RepID=UPI003D2BCC6F
MRAVASAAAPLAAAGFVESAAAGGEGLCHLALREILPNLRATVLALFGLRFVEAVYVISMAGFLQLGPQPPTADWALMIRENASGILLNPWAVVAPALAIGLLAISVNLAADTVSPTAGRRAVSRRWTRRGATRGAGCGGVRDVVGGGGRRGRRRPQPRRRTGPARRLPTAHRRRPARPPPGCALGRPAAPGRPRPGARPPARRPAPGRADRGPRPRPPR